MPTGGNLERVLRGLAYFCSPDLLVEVDKVTVDLFARLSITLRNGTRECILH